MASCASTSTCSGAVRARLDYADEDDDEFHWRHHRPSSTLSTPHPSSWTGVWGIYALNLIQSTRLVPPFPTPASLAIHNPVACMPFLPLFRVHNLVASVSLHILPCSLPDALFDPTVFTRAHRRQTTEGDTSLKLDSTPPPLRMSELPLPQEAS
ncbi:hypothetical protein R3P38DRAFT_3269289 [Favolaschia claudopus]|uniref:Uncharacterized protein n=1 Tax=Favolaschia claudopus TaxID=2862362 RepID=A0AAW0BJB2_9AGAR